MNKTELIDTMAEKTGLSKKDTKAVLEAFTNTVADEMKKKNTVSIIGFGTFSTSERQARN